MAPAFNQTLILSKNLEKIVTREPFTATKFWQRHFVCNMHIVYLRKNRVSVAQLQMPVMIGEFTMLENLHVKNPIGLVLFGLLLRSYIVRYAAFACWYLLILQSDFDKNDR
jgi:hypothetical protein